MHTYVDKLLAKTFIYITLGWDYILDCIFIISAQTTRAQLNDEERKKRHDNERRSKLIKLKHAMRALNPSLYQRGKGWTNHNTLPLR
jgi:hypothetical protein